jgi:hypothetical protein
METLNDRALATMQEIASAYASGETLWGPDRNLVTRETAADAIVDVFATLDALREGVQLPPGRIEHTIAMLMLIRESVVPLQVPESDEPLLRQDLGTLAEELRKARRDFGLPS